METRNSSIRWKTLREKHRHRNEKSKFQCWLCKKTFDNDCSSNCNKKYHRDYAKSERPTHFHTASVFLNRFTVVSKKRARTSETPTATEVI